MTEISKDPDLAAIEALTGGKADPNPAPVVVTDPPVTKVEPVVTDPPIKVDDPPAGDPPPPPVMPEGAFSFKETFDGFKDINEVKGVLGQFKEFQTKNTTLQQELKDARMSFREGEDETLYKLRMINKTNPEGMELARSLFYGKPSSVDLMKLQLKDTVPAFKDMSDEKLTQFIEKKYNVKPDYSALDRLDKTDDNYQEDYNRIKSQIDSDVEQSQMLLEVEAATAKESLLSKYNDIEIPKNLSPEEIKESEQKKSNEWSTEWTPHIPNIKKELSTFEVPVIGEDNKEGVLMSIEIPQEQLASLMNEAFGQLYSGYGKPTEDNIQFVKNFVESAYFATNKIDITTQIVNKVKSMSEEDLRAIYTHPSSRKNVDVSSRPAPVKKKTTESELAAQDPDFKKWQDSQK